MVAPLIGVVFINGVGNPRQAFSTARGALGAKWQIHLLPPELSHHFLRALSHYVEAATSNLSPKSCPRVSLTSFNPSISQTTSPIG